MHTAGSDTPGSQPEKTGFILTIRIQCIYELTAPNAQSSRRLNFKASSSAYKNQKRKQSRSYPCTALRWCGFSPRL